MNAEVYHKRIVTILETCTIVRLAKPNYACLRFLTNVPFMFHVSHQRVKVSLDLSGFLESVSFLPPDVQAGSGKVTERDRFLSVQIDVMKVAPAPETATYIQRLEIERREKEKSQGQDNRSFLSKYWMYIVPIVIFMLISGASNPEGQ